MTDFKQAMLQALDALDSNNPDIHLRAAVTLRAALAAQQPQFEAVTPQPQPNVLPDHEEYGAGMYFRTTQQPELVIAKGKRLIMVDETFDNLVYWLERCDDNGHLENCSDLIEPWSKFQYTEVLHD